MRYLAQSTLGALLRAASKKIGCLFATSILATALLRAGCGANSATWTNTGGQVSKFGTDALVYDSVHNVLYAGCEQQVGQAGETAGRGVWKYDGKSWTDAGLSSSVTSIASLAYDGKHNLLYAGTLAGGGVLKYTGSEWMATGWAVSTSWVNSLAYDSAGDVLNAGAGSGTEEVGHFGQGVWKYAGTNWTETIGAVANRSVKALVCGSDGEVYASCYQNGAGDGVWRYNGTTWANTGDAASGRLIESLAYDSNHNLLYAGCSGHGGGAGADFGVWRFRPEPSK